MNNVKCYRDLDVWQKSMDFVEQIYRDSKHFPPDERFGLTSQLRRAAISVPSNIAEGAGRTGTREFLRFLSVANGSLAEVETLLILAVRTGILPQARQQELDAQAMEIGRMLTGLKRSLQLKS